MSGHDELAQLAEEFNQLTGRLQVNEEERRRFVSDASHELKTPLASIRLMTDSILQDASIDRETTREFVADISDAADRLIHISQELLELDRLDQGRDLDRRAIDLNEAGRTDRPDAGPPGRVGPGHHDLDPGEGCLVRCNDKDAGQILKNLMENAIKYNVLHGQVD
ncbi:MAG: histidine kinase dimerization/phospho-acceptor domain-containing protein [Evtepia sp.]